MLLFRNYFSNPRKTAAMKNLLRSRIDETRHSKLNFVEKLFFSFNCEVLQNARDRIYTHSELSFQNIYSYKLSRDFLDAKEATHNITTCISDAEF